SSEKGRFSVGTAAQLFGTRYYGSEPTALVGRTYDVSPDGQRLLMIKSEPGRNPAGASPHGHVLLVLNLAGDLTRLIQQRKELRFIAIDRRGRSPLGDGHDRRVRPATRCAMSALSSPMEITDAP